MSWVESGRGRAVAALVSGTLFGLGLAISGMTDPDKVRNFLDVFGSWDPSLLVVMGAAVAVTFTGFRLVARRARPWLDRRFHLPASTRVDRALLGGAFVFGVGWGLGGYCPGPAVASLAWGSSDAALFVVAMLVGIVGVRLARAALAPRAA